MNKKLTIPLFIGLITLMFIISGCLNTKTDAEEQKIPGINPNLKFYVDSCDPESIADEEESRGIINSTWVNNDTIIITAYTHSICGGCSLYGGYEVQDNNLILKTDEICGEVITRCVCPKMITYEISNLERKDYSISFQ